MNNRVSRSGLILMAIILLAASSALASTLTVAIKSCDGSTAIENRLVRFEYDTGSGPQSQELQTGSEGLVACSDPDFGPDTVVTVKVYIPPVGPTPAGWAVFEAHHGSGTTPDWTPQLPSPCPKPNHVCAVLSQDGDPDDVEGRVAR